MSNELKTAIGIVIKILGGEDITAEAMNELFEITNGNKKVIYEHIKAISNIFNIAKKELEEGSEKVEQ